MDNALRCPPLAHRSAAAQTTVTAAVKREGVEVELQNTLRTLRYKLFAKAGHTGKEGRTAIPKLALPMRHRDWFEGIWNRAKTFDLPITFTPAITP